MSIAKRQIAYALFALLMSNSGVAVGGDQSPACVTQTQVSADKTEIHNGCSGQVTVLYCSTTRKIAGSKCGEQKSEYNPYYTNARTVAPGEKVMFIDAAGHKYAVCGRAMNTWGGLKGEFSSTTDGSYDCNPPKAQPTLSTEAPRKFISSETANDIGVACERAQTDVRKILGKSGPCHCQLMSKDSPDVTAVYRCTTTTDLKGASSQALKALEELKSDAPIGQCPPSARCRNRIAATGVRG